jgi:hypothetical protein
MSNRLLALIGTMILVVTLLVACGAGNDSGSGGTATSARPYNVWQNPYMSTNPGNNIHNDSYLSDSYNFAGPAKQGQATVTLAELSTYNDPATGQSNTIVLGECASITFDADSNIQSVCAGLPAGPGATSSTRYVVTLDRNTLDPIAIFSFEKPVNANQTGVDFGGAGYFYQDNQYRMVVALPDGTIRVLRRTPSTAGGIDSYTSDASYNITGINGAVTVANSSLYAVVPDKVGNIWFTTAQGAVGTVTPAGVISWLNLNDASSNPGTSGLEGIANSHSIDQGDTTNGASGVYILSTYGLYRFGASSNGTPSIVWKATYDRGTGIKSGQVSWGSGSSPTIFNMNNRRFVTIADNAQYMNVNVYRAEATLETGEQRLFAQVAPFGQNASVSDENSLIVAANSDGSSIDIYAENNYGNDTVTSTLGSKTTQPGFARMNLTPSGLFTVASVNNTISVPSIVSKVSLVSNIIYTYNKTADGWYITGLDATDLNKVIFTNKTGDGLTRYNNYYSGLSIAPDGSIWLGVTYGLMKITIN